MYRSTQQNTLKKYFWYFKSWKNPGVLSPKLAPTSCKPGALFVPERTLISIDLSRRLIGVFKSTEQGCRTSSAQLRHQKTHKIKRSRRRSESVGAIYKTPALIIPFSDMRHSSRHSSGFSHVWEDLTRAASPHGSGRTGMLHVRWHALEVIRQEPFPSHVHLSSRRWQ